MRLIDLTGQRFEKLTVLERSFTPSREQNPKRRAYWLCQCDCGNKKVIVGDSLRSGDSTSCGCFQRERISKRSTKHGYSTDKRGIEPEYTAWCNARRRCLETGNWQYPNYGGRGIRFFEGWQGEHGFENFISHIGPKPEPKRKFSLDRIDVNGNYEPGNVRWATYKQQSDNRRVKYITDFSDHDLLAEVTRRGLSC